MYHPVDQALAMKGVLVDARDKPPISVAEKLVADAAIELADGLERGSGAVAKPRLYERSDR
tara:strand:+ start:318 stop:500 length:183 start_codon:yes stop_codon:yes gene_type:complete